MPVKIKIIISQYGGTKHATNKILEKCQIMFFKQEKYKELAFFNNSRKKNQRVEIGKVRKGEFAFQNGYGRPFTHG